MFISNNRVADSSLVLQELEFVNKESMNGMERNAEMIYDQTNGDLKKSAYDADTRGTEPSNHEQDLQKLRKMLKLLCMSMAVFGIFNLDNVYRRMDSDKKEREKKDRSKVFQTHSVYCYILSFIFVANFVRSVSAFFVGENANKNIAFRIVVSTWNLQITLNTLIMLKTSHPRWGYQGRACYTWDTEVLSLMDCLRTRLNGRKVKKILTGIFITGWGAVIVNLGMMPPIVFQIDSPFADLITDMMVAPFQHNNCSKLIALVFYVFQTVAWIVPVLYLTAYCFIMRAGFKVCKTVLSKTIDDVKETNMYPECLYRQRMLHLNISKCLDLLDKDFRYMYANLFFTSVPLACFILYQILKTDTELVETTALFFWLVANVIFVAMATLCGAAVNNAAHSPLDCIYEVGMKGITLEQLGQLNLFTSKLNGSPVGFTVMTFVTITKELLLTVGGLYITYFFILLQF